MRLLYNCCSENPLEEKVNTSKTSVLPSLISEAKRSAKADEMKWSPLHSTVKYSKSEKCVWVSPELDGSSLLLE